MGSVIKTGNIYSKNGKKIKRRERYLIVVKERGQRKPEREKDRKLREREREKKKW